MQKTGGIYKALSSGFLYAALQECVAGSAFRKEFADRYIRARAGSRVLDMGCGTGDILAFLPDVHYVGFDLSDRYIERARRCYGVRGRFEVGDVNTVESVIAEKFDLVLAMGVLHHLDDLEVENLSRAARKSLVENGRFVSIDPTFVEDQNVVSRLLAKNDRGRNVRSPGELATIAEKHFRSVNLQIRHDLYRIPYTHVIMEASI